MPLRLQTVDHALFAVADLALAEVDHECQSQVEEAEIDEGLRLEDEMIGGGYLTFNDNSPFDQQI